MENRRLTGRTGPGAGRPSKLYRRAGREIAGATDASALPRLEGVAQVLASLGYEPRLEDDRVDLANCPFDTLAEKHTELVCGLNRSFVQGFGDGLGGGVAACLEPQEGQCCVRVRSHEVRTGIGARP